MDIFNLLELNTKRMKSYIKQQKTSQNIIIKFAIRILFFIWKIARTLIRFCFNPDYRSILFMQVFHATEVHQTTSLTYMNRYPIIFEACREYFINKNDLSILSYGCSTGEEVLTLRQYFPDAKITGTDINKHSIALCKKLPVDKKIAFVNAIEKEFLAQDKYDLIFCMAVLQTKPHEILNKGIKNLKKIYPFEKFEQKVIELDKLLNLGGLLAIHFTQYSLMDTVLSYKYEAVGEYNQGDYVGPVFDKDSKINNNQKPFKSIYKKLKI